MSGDRDAVTGARFEFLTSEMTLPPGWMAHLRRLRWEIVNHANARRRIQRWEWTRARLATANRRRSSAWLVWIGGCHVDNDTLSTPGRAGPGRICLTQDGRVV